MAARTGPGDWPAFVDEADEAHIACRGTDTNLFFPEPGEAWKVPRAKAICARCPLLRPCRDWALDQSAQQLDGIWGGTTRNWRRKRKKGTGEQPAQFRKNTDSPRRPTQ